MANLPALENKVREQRDGHGWSQEELARRSGLSRAGVSAIETGRLVPSTAAALALAEALGCRVEDLFHLPRTPPKKAAWAWPPRSAPCRYWHALVMGQTRYYPVEASPLGMLPHDGIFRNDAFEESGRGDPAHTLVLACCDPAGGLLVDELARSSGVRLITVPRSSTTALALLRQGLVHAAGVHLSRADAPGGNAAIVRSRIGPGFSLLHVAQWEEGITFAPSQSIGSIRDAVRANLRWIGREAGSGARECLDELLGARRAPRRLASDHRGVAEAVRCGWADAGVCLRLASEEAGLEFLSVRREAYDICFPDALKGDPRLQALIGAVRSPSYRRLLGELPGYDSTAAGKLERVS
jgi:molybdate-binding protein/transcriptional regulator with XRE-family HTH domain